MTAPTEEQLNDPKWWDENAPKWAKSFGFAGVQRLPVFFNVKQYQYLYGNRQVIPMSERQTFALGDIEHAAKRPTTPPAPEWDGEGLPPVGVECQYRAKGGSLNNGPHIDWLDCKVLAVTHFYAILSLSGPGIGYGHECSVTLSRSEFRPLRTQAEREREELADLCRAKFNQHTSSSNSYLWQQVADAIIAAGWRKGDS